MNGSPLIPQEVEVRSHAKLDPEIKAMRAINRALAALPDDDHRRRVMGELSLERRGPGAHGRP